MGAVQLHSEKGRVTSVTVGQAALDPHSPALTIPDGELPARGYQALPQADGSSVFVGRRAGAIVALDGHCTHMGCPIRWDDASDTFKCSCHGGVFDSDGKPIAGPPQAPLVSLAVVGRVVQPGLLTSATSALPCDYCVVACEVRGLQQLVRRSELAAPVLNGNVAQLGEADPYVVYRLWLDRPVLPSRNPFYTTSRFDYTDSLAIYSHFQEPYRSWARRTGGAVVEVHAYAIAPEELRPAADIRAAMRAELWRLLPELAGARVLHEEYQQQSNFHPLGARRLGAPSVDAHRSAQPIFGGRPRQAAGAGGADGGRGDERTAGGQRGSAGGGPQGGPRFHGRADGPLGLTHIADLPWKMAKMCSRAPRPVSPWCNQ